MTAGRGYLVGHKRHDIAQADNRLDGPQPMSDVRGHQDITGCGPRFPGALRSTPGLL
ncbi:MAG: hypothetical protein H6Q86_1116 [candidate division NC10 bacterium]|nr:hypothetical protein [candidate division NC10 bacterium]